MAGEHTDLRNLDEIIKILLAKGDGESLSTLFNSLSASDALRELLRRPPRERDAVLSLLAPGLAAMFSKRHQPRWRSISSNGSMRA